MTPYQIVGLIVNIFFPGIGTLIVGKIVQGIIQIILLIVAIVLNFTVILAILGFPLLLIVWIWGIISAVTPKNTKGNKTES